MREAERTRLVRRVTDRDDPPANGSDAM